MKTTIHKGIIAVIITLINLLGFHKGISQTDSLYIMTFEAYMEIVRDHHPMARQAELQLNKGEANLLVARGAFDPKAFTDISQKYFSDKQYYSLFNGGVKIPTWFGLEFQSGFEQNTGEYINPENNTPSGGLVYAGISLPVGQGLFIDQRRAELRKAEEFMNIAESQKAIMLNELYLEAGMAYWQWFMTFNTMRIYENALEIAEDRFDAIKQGVTMGDRPSIDTLEAGIQVQNRQLRYIQSQLDFENATSQISIYLWINGSIPVELTEETIPLDLVSAQITSYEDVLSENMDSLLPDHPEAKKLIFYLNQLDIEKKWKKEQLKPVVNLKYNPIFEPVAGDAAGSFNMNNYKWGLEFKFPVFLRKERGAVQLMDAKIQEMQYGYSQKLATLEFKAEKAINKWRSSEIQYDVYQQTVQDYKGLLDGEQRKFFTGESSLFMVNSREMSYINARIKLVELLVKNKEAYLETRYAFGLI